MVRVIRTMLSNLKPRFRLQSGKTITGGSNQASPSYFEMK